MPLPAEEIKKLIKAIPDASIEIKTCRDSNHYSAIIRSNNLIS